MNLKRIRLELARTKDFPEGNSRCGYELVAPLTPDGHLDAKAWGKVRTACTVRRFWEGEDDENGNLIHKSDGRWVFSYAPGDDDDEPIFRLDRHVFKEGEYISITEHDGVTRPFRIVSIR
ncbi:MAG TPA: hypothetical protein VF342_15205 [Alphaproteobacteria bacterium]